MSFNLDRDFLIDVAFGNVGGTEIVSKFGSNPDINTATVPEDVWDAGGIWVPPTIARIHNLVSTDANDTAGGTGARIIKLIGLDASWNPLEETVILAGLVPVATVNTFNRIFRMILVSAGTSLNNAGVITATALTDGTVTAQISIGNSQTDMAIYTVPAAKTAVLYGLYSSMYRNGTLAGAMLSIVLLVREAADVATSPWLIKRHIGFSVEGSSGILDSTILLKIPEKSDIKVQVKISTDNNIVVASGFSLILVDN